MIQFEIFKGIAVRRVNRSLLTCVRRSTCRVSCCTAWCRSTSCTRRRCPPSCRCSRGSCRGRRRPLRSRRSRRSTVPPAGRHSRGSGPGRRGRCRRSTAATLRSPSLRSSAHASCRRAASRSTRSARPARSGCRRSRRAS